MLLNKKGNVELWVVGAQYMVLAPTKFRKFGRLWHAMEYFAQLTGSVTTKIGA